MSASASAPANLRRSPAHQSSAVRVFFLAWFAVALALASAGLPDLALSGRPWIIPLALWSITLGVGVLAWKWAPLRAWAKTVDLRWPILFHVVRIGFGAAFLWLYARGELAERFALRAGPGDIAAGALALVAAIAAARNTPARRRIVLAWNALALADMIVTIVSAQSVLFSPDVASMAAFTRLPYSLLPFFVVPMVLLTHALIFFRLWMAARAR
jgi:hypothetical protein